MGAREKLEDGNGHTILDGGQVGILLIHGLGGTPADVKFVAQALNRASHTVYSPLLAGHGGTVELLNTTTWRDWYRSVEDAHDALKERCDVIITGGLSSGVLLALHLAAQHPQDVLGTLLFSPTFWPNGWAIPRHFALFKLIRHKWLANLINLRERAPYGIKDERIRRIILNSLHCDGQPMVDTLWRRGGTILEFRRLAKVVEKELGQIEQPALVFHPRFDDQSDISNAILLLRKLGGVVELVVLNDSYHLVTVDRQRADVADRSVTFSARLALQHRQQRELLPARRGAANSI